MAARVHRGGRRRGRPLTAGFLALAVGLALAACDGDEEAGAERVAEPTAGQWDTWVLDSAEDIAVPPPPEDGSPEAEAELAEIAQLADDPPAAVLAAIERWGSEVPGAPWTEMMLEILSERSKQVPRSTRNYALVHVAMYDAVLAAWHWKYVYNRPAPDVDGVQRRADPGPDPSYPSEHAAVAGAASRVIAHLYPDRPAPRLDMLAEEAGQSRVVAGAATRSDVGVGLELGRQVAEGVIARAQTDGSDVEWDGTRPEGIGGGPEFWEPPPGRVVLPDDPLAATWDTWVLPSTDMFRPPPPPAYGSPEFVEAAEELVEIKENLTPEQLSIAMFWEGDEGTPLPGGIVIREALKDIRAADLTTPRSARGLALLTMALDDAALAAWDAKFAYWGSRPENAIRDLGLDPEWRADWPTPRFPAYPSGSAGYGGAAESVLSYLLPDRAEDFRERAEEQAISRLYAGIHWRYDHVSLDAGRQVGQLVVERAKADGADR
ncbi:MAG: phosphatase PAP2 family protein [Egibacteraceae bacterium]